MIDVQINTSRLEAAISEFATVARKDLSDVWRQQGGILVAHVIALTPPGGQKGQSMTDSGGIDLAAKKRGEASIAADITKIFPTSRIAHDKLVGMVNAGFEFQTGKGRKDTVRDVAETVEDLRRVHQFARNHRTGRTRKIKGIGMAITRKAVLKKYIKQEIAKVGKLSAGWLPAARELRTVSRNVPAWIVRHGPRNGGADVNDKGGRIGIRIFNNQAWFPGNMEARVRIALARCESGLVKSSAAVLANRAAAAERRMGR